MNMLLGLVPLALVLAWLGWSWVGRLLARVEAAESAPARAAASRQRMREAEAAWIAAGCPDERGV